MLTVAFARRYEESDVEDEAFGSEDEEEDEEEEEENSDAEGML